MVNILVVDDCPEKLQNISRLLEPFVGENVSVVKCNDINSAKRELKNNNFDIMILDIYLPQTFGDTVMQNGGMKLLNEIKKSRFYSYPRYVISVSRYKESTEIFKESEGNIHTAIVYDTTTSAWEEKLTGCLEAAISVVCNSVIHRIYNYDIAVICALKEEIEFITEIIENVEKIPVDYDDDIYYSGHFMKDEKKIRIVFSIPNQMGMVATTSLATKIINNFAPRYLVMTGITGGTKEDKMNFGDVIVASKSWDYRAGKDTRNEGVAHHLNTINQYSIDTTLLSYCRQLAENTTELRGIKDSFKHGDKPDSELKLLIGPVVSGASVVTDPDIVKDILDNQDRNILGIEMEIYGMYYAANWAMKPRPMFIAMKSVSDFANSDKGDKYHKYASYTSAKVFEVLAKNYFNYS